MTRRLYQPSNPAQAQGLNISATLDLDADDYVEVYAEIQINSTSEHCFVMHPSKRFIAQI